MRRYGIIALLVALTACSASADPTTTSTEPPDFTTTSTSTSSTTTTTTAPTTTTTQYRMGIEGAGEPLVDLITSLYRVSEGGEPPIAPPGVLKRFLAADAAPPPSGEASVADWDEETRLAVVKSGPDVTLAIRDPKWRVVGGWWPSMGIGPHLGSFPKVVAVVGSDARPGEDRERTRADSIHFVAIHKDRTADLVGVPRDSWVPIPGSGSSKINASLAFGGPDMMMGTFTELTDLDFDGYFLTGFAGFEGLIDVLGGLDINVPRDFNDRAAKAYLDAGEQILDAAGALAMSRTRKTLPSGDFQRQEHGGLVMQAAQAMLRAQGILGLPQTLVAAKPHVSTDLSPSNLLRIGAAAIRVDPDEVVNVVAPGGTGSAGGASVVFLSNAAQDIWPAMADGTLEPAD